MDTKKTISAVEARTHFGEIMKKSFKNKERFVVEKSGIPMVVILNADEFSKIVEEREERFQLLNQIRSKLPNIKEEEITNDVAEALKAVRKKHA